MTMLFPMNPKDATIMPRHWIKVLPNATDAVPRTPYYKNSF